MTRAARPKSKVQGITFSQELFDAICLEMAEGASLRSICARDDMPNKRTVLRWIEGNESLQCQYSEAQNLRAEHYFDQILEIADNVRIGSRTTTKSDGEKEIVRGDMIERARLQVDARKWVLARMNPKKYGDKFTQELTGDGGGPVVVEVVKFAPEPTQEPSDE